MADIPITDQLDDERVAIALDAMLPDIYHQVALSTMLLNTFETAPYKEERNGGARVRVPMRTGKNSSFKMFGKGDTHDPQIYPSARFGYYNFKQGAGSVMIDWVEERQQAGGGNVIELLTMRVMDLVDSIREEMNRMLWRSSLDDPLDMNGIPALIPTDPRTGIMVGHDRASHIWFRNCYWDNNASGYAYGAPPIDVTLGAPANVGAFGTIAAGGGYSAGLRLMGIILDNCSEGENLSDYVILTESAVYQYYVDSAQHMRGIQIAYSQNDSIMKWNFGGALFRGVPILRDSVNMGAPSGEMRFVNKKYTQLVTDSGAWFKWSEDRSPFNQFTKARFLMLRGQTVEKIPRKNGVLQGITAWA